MKQERGAVLTHAVEARAGTTRKKYNKSSKVKKH